MAFCPADFMSSIKYSMYKRLFNFQATYISPTPIHPKSLKGLWPRDPTKKFEDFDYTGENKSLITRRTKRWAEQL